MNMKTNKIHGCLGAMVEGVVQCLVVDARTKKVIKTYPSQPNLILNQGLGYWFAPPSGVYGWSSLMICAVAGTGTTPTKDDSGTTQAVQAGTTVTLSGGSFVFTNTATDAGKMIKWDTAEEAMIVTVTDPTHAEVNLTQSVASAEFSVYRTNQTGMAAETKRTTDKVDGANGTVFPSPNLQVNWRTFDFTEETGPVTYTEIGMSHTSTVTNNLYMRTLLATTVSLIAGQQLRVVYTQNITWTPATPRAKTADVPGWPVAPAVTTEGDEGIEYLRVYTILSDGQGSGATTYGGLEPGMSGTQIFMSVLSTALVGAPVTSPVVLNSMIYYANPSWEAYVPNSFQRVRYLTVPPASGNSTSIRSLFLGYRSGSDTVLHSYFRFVFDEAQTKDNLHRLTIRFLFAASRVLSA